MNALPPRAGTGSGAAGGSGQASHLWLVPDPDQLGPAKGCADLDGAAFGAADLEEEGLEEDGLADEISMEELHELALSMLARRPWTRKELVEALERNFDPCAVMEVVYGLEHVGLIDDAAYARDYVARKGRQRGRRALANELRNRGVPAEITTHVLDDPDRADDERAARALVAKRLPAMARLDPHVRARRLADQLTRRGFDGALVGRLLREVDDIDPQASR